MWRPSTRASLAASNEAYYNSSASDSTSLNPAPPVPASSSRSGWVDLVILAPIVTLFCIISYSNLSHPGLYGDEAWAPVYAARFVWQAPVIDTGPNRQFQLFGLLFPFMANNYIGPIQTYILASAFALFGVSVPAIRITTSLLGLAGILFFFLLVRREFGRFAAALSALLLATDLTYILMTRHDFGVISFSLFAQPASLYFLFRWLRSRRPEFLFLGFLLLGLGVTHRFNFLAFVAATCMAGVLFYGRMIKWSARNIIVGLSGFLVGAFPILLYNILTAGATFKEGNEMAVARGHLLPHSSNIIPFLETLPNAILQRMNSVRHVAGGCTIANSIIGERIEDVSLFGGSLLPGAMLLAIPLLVLHLRFVPSSRRLLGFFTAVGAFTLVAVAAIPIATGPHHVMAVYPIPHLLVGVTFALLWHGVSRRPFWVMCAGRSLVAIVGALVILSNILIANIFYQRLRATGGHWLWSEAIYRLADFLDKENSGKTIVLLDWGIEQPLIILSQGELNLRAPYWRMLGEKDSSDWLIPWIRAPRLVFVLRSKKFAWNQSIHERFESLYKQQTDLVVKEHKVFQKNGEHAFSVLKFRRSQAASGIEKSFRQSRLASDANLLMNPGFEMLDSVRRPSGWSPYGEPLVTRRAHKGKIAVGSGASFLLQAVRINGGRTYVLGHFTRADLPNQLARLQINWGDDRGATLRVDLELVQTTSKWKWNEIEVTAPSGATTAGIFLQTHEKNEVWFDDVWFGKVERIGNSEGNENSSYR